MGAEWVIKKTHTCILVSPRYSNMRVNHLDPQMAVKKPKNWEEFYLTVVHRG